MQRNLIGPLKWLTLSVFAGGALIGMFLLVRQVSAEEHKESTFFSGAFPFWYIEQENLNAYADFYKQAEMAHWVTVFIEEQDKDEMKLVADGAEVTEKNYLAVENRKAGMLVSFSFLQSFEIHSGGRRLLFDIGEPRTRETIAVDTTGIAVRFVYLPEGAGFG